MGNGTRVGQHQRRDPLWMTHRIMHREDRSGRVAKYAPAFLPQALAEGFEVADHLGGVDSGRLDDGRNRSAGSPEFDQDGLPLFGDLLRHRDHVVAIESGASGKKQDRRSTAVDPVVQVEILAAERFMADHFKREYITAPARLTKSV